MKPFNSALKMIALAMALSQLPAQAATTAEIAKGVEACKGNRGTSFGQMPWGATDQDLVSYQGKNLCTNNKGRPIGENCEKTLDKLYQVASELNQMVKAGCGKYVPIVMKLDSEGKCSGKECLEYNNADMKAAKAELAKFRIKLKEFSKVMKEQQRYVSQSSENVVQVLEQNESARNTPAYQNAGYAASQMGVSSISESDKLNNFQDASAAGALVKEIQSRFSDSESRYTNVSEANYDKMRQPIVESFSEVGKLQSRVLREQLHGFLKAEELKLATKLYDNQLTATETTTNKLIATNEKSMGNLNSLGAAGSAAPLLGALGTQPNGSSLSGETFNTGSGLNSGSNTSSGSYSTAGNETHSLTAQGAAKTALASVGIDSLPDGAKEGGMEGSISNASAASRAPASLKESLRQKLAAAAKNGGALDASLASGASASGGGDDAERKSASLAGGGALSGDQAMALGLGGGAADPMLEGFSAEGLEQGGIYIPGSGIEESVRELVGEFESALGDFRQSNDIAGAETPSLFARVREFHGRCLKRGCVMGTGKREI